MVLESLACGTPVIGTDVDGLGETLVRLEPDLVVPSGDPVALAERLEAEGLPVVSRWQYLIVGAGSQDEANELAQRLKREAPADSVLHVEPGGGLAWQALGNNPFAVFGGLAG